MPLVFLTAWHMLVGRARLKAGETVLIIGGGSGVGSAAIQVAKHLGARVIATAGSEPKLERVRALGADATIDHSRQDIAAEARAFTDKAGVEVVFEHVGGRVFEAGVAALARNGRLVTCGATIGNTATLDLNVLFGRHLSLLGSWMGTRAESLAVLERVRAGAFRAVVDSVLPLAEARRAHERMEARSSSARSCSCRERAGRSRYAARVSRPRNPRQATRPLRASRRAVAADARVLQAPRQIGRTRLHRHRRRARDRHRRLPHARAAGLDRRDAQRVDDPRRAWVRWIRCQPTLRSCLPPRTRSSAASCS
jgi:NAD(P)-dependent dehydrogenase (short-subunit alcohol dehydrogenase family)